MTKVTTAVLPVAGRGTRFLPATRAIPKEMLPIVDRPLIDHAVAEARAAGITRFVFVTAPGKEAIERHFAGEGLDLVSVIQDEMRGLGHAIWCARDHIDDAAFAILLPDDLMTAADGEPLCLARMAEARGARGGNMVALETVAPERTASYGVVAPGARDGDLIEIKCLVEKPAPEAAPSSLAIIGRYILEPEIMQVLEHQAPGAGGEIQLTDAMATLLESRPFHGLADCGRRFDCGSPAGFIAANVAMGLARPDIAPALRELLK